MSGFEYVFPAIRGIQAGREYYVSMCPMRLLPKIFLFDEEELVPELRAQRLINKSRLPEMTRYITSNPDTYVFSAITVSVDAEARFDSIAEEGDASRVGMLHIPMSARFIINDGQHRRAAMERALREKPDLGDETIAVVFFLDPGLERCQQMFADLNRYAIRPSKSLSILYDHRDYTAQLTKALIAKSPAFRDLVELEKTSLAPGRAGSSPSVRSTTPPPNSSPEWTVNPSISPNWRCPTGRPSPRGSPNGSAFGSASFPLARYAWTTFTHTASSCRPSAASATRSFANVHSSGRRSSPPLSALTGVEPTAPSGRAAPSPAAGSRKPARASCSPPTSSRTAFDFH